ncbi:Growth-regulating factor 1 [Rhynchospora pubera]|uniref:Growth-regulating factor n=1 Tax=Rhynchospora pubera TaxID=906938 RepID=A0AAV8D1K1_9POAL|nr:Growth-regulating factor 1 [Rhynchospora pubera]
MEGALVSSSETPELSPRETILFGSGSFKRDRFTGLETEEARQWRFAKVSRSDSMATNSVFSNGEGQMLSFASPNSDGSLHSNYYNASNQTYFRNEGAISASMQGAMGRLKGPFTPSQWMELEHQALVYKYLAANVPIPPTLLVPIRRSLSSSGFSSPFAPAYFGSSTSGWGGHPYTMGYALTMTGGAGDPEPGRCRRTDGKKWRCSRDAVADQKYCERHINRGRHRSRKHVEPNSNRLSSSTKSTTTTNTSKLARTTATPAHSQSQTKDLCTALSASCSDPPFDSTMVDRDQESASLLSPMLPFAKQQESPNTLPETDSSSAEFGTHTLRHFIDNWPKTNTNQQYQSYDSWPDMHEETHSETTQLSISIPSMGGPLGEVLTKNCGTHNTALMKGQCKGLNLLTDAWDLDSSPRHGSSPTGVLQKSSFGSLSSSAGSSPRPESYKSHEDLGSILVNHLSKISYV